MRQAGRYLPDTARRARRPAASLAMAKTPDLACEITLQPLVRFDLDAAILFSTSSPCPDAMGLGLYSSYGEGPKFERPGAQRGRRGEAAVPDMGSELRYVMDAVSLIRRELGRPRAADRSSRAVRGRWPAT